MADDEAQKPLNIAELLRESPVRAFEMAQQAARKDPDSAPAIRLMAAALRRLGEGERAKAADQAAIAASMRAPDLRTAAAALADNQVGIAERHVRAHLRRDPLDPAALRMLADLAARAGRFDEAEALLRRALRIAPAFAAAYTELAILLHKQDRLDEAIAAMDALLREMPDEVSALHFKATLLAQGGRLDEALAISAMLLERFPEEAKGWLARAQWLRAVGRTDEAAQAIRRAIALAPTSGDAWWAWADLKTARFSSEDIAAMEKALADAALGERDRMLIAFALGKAHEDAGEGEAAFAHYRTGNAMRRAMLRYDPEETSALVDRGVALLAPDIERVSVQGGDAPIFVVGMHRAGSTLVEQILASHSAIEGIAELPQVRRFADELARQGAYPDLLAGFDAERSAALGADYLARTAAHRRTYRPHFIDKMPGNWKHLPLILRMLPEARIVDVRRHPLDCCWSNFRQFYAQGQAHSCDLVELGRFYRDYVRMTAAIDAALPGRVHRIHYEALVDDTESEVRRLLDALGLAFEPQCLRFYETKRSVRTPSAEQVRRPINAQGIGKADTFAPWLGPLREALGDVLDCYPAVPDSIGRVSGGSSSRVR